MQLTAVLVLAQLAAAMAAPQNSAHAGTAPDPSTYENIDVTNFSLVETPASEVSVVTFTINGAIQCSAPEPGTEGKVFGCGDASYSFGLLDVTDKAQYGLNIYKQTSPSAGFFGTGVIDVYCRLGGLNSTICDQTSVNTIVIS